MSRIKLRNLLNLTEQAPMAPDPMGMGAPVPAPMAPPAGGPDPNIAGQPQDQQLPPTPESGPDPSDPGEYDFTKDFREFEDKKNKAEAEAKKVVLDKMNEKLLGKTIVANASRGYGQPKTDYTIKNVKKVSVEFWYKDYVVIAQDENEKKYFLTPGINIKIEGEGSEPAPQGNEPQAGAEQQPGAEQPPAGEEAPNQPPAGGPPQPGAEQPAAPPAPDAAAQPPAPQAAPAPQAQPPVQPPQEPDQQQKKKKKAPVAEIVQKDLNNILCEFMSDRVKDENGKVNFIPYIVDSKELLSEGKNIIKIKCKLEIPENHMVNRPDLKDIRLAAVDTLRTSSGNGKYSRGNLDARKNGRYYFLEFFKETGWNQ